MCSLTRNMYWADLRQPSTVGTEMNVRIAGTQSDSIVDGPGLRYTIFFQGCTRGCRGCQNPETWDVNGGQVYDVQDFLEKVSSEVERNPLIKGITFSGGEPFLQPQALLHMVDYFNAKGYHIVVYTGFTYEELLHSKEARAVLNKIDWLVDGPFEEEHKSLELRFRGSTNQRIIDLLAHRFSCDTTSLPDVVGPAKLTYNCS